MKPQDEELCNIKEEDVGEEVQFKIDKDSFRGPFKCHGKKTRLVEKKMSHHGIDFTYSAWCCMKCRKEYLDFEQAARLEKFWVIKKLLEDNLIAIERNMNFDGRSCFFRLPKEMAKGLHKGDVAGIKLLSPDGKMFLVEIKGRAS